MFAVHIKSELNTVTKYHVKNEMMHRNKK